MMAYGQRVIRRGDIYYVNNNRGQVGSEMKKDRPAVIVSNDTNNQYSREVTVVFLTSQPKKDMITHVTVFSTGRESTALCEAPTTLDKQRVSNYLGHVSKREMAEIEEGLRTALDLPGEIPGGGAMQRQMSASTGKRKQTRQQWKREHTRRCTRNCWRNY